MKVFATVEEYGGRTRMRPDWRGTAIHFDGEQPAEYSLLTLEWEGLAEPTSKAMIEWLTAQAGKPKPTRADRKQIHEVKEGQWRYAVLDDFIDAHNYRLGVWRVESQFSLLEQADFADRWLPEARQRLRDAAALDPGRERAEALRAAQGFVERVLAVVERVPRSMGSALQQELLALDLARVEALQAGEFEPEAWVTLAAELDTTAHQKTLLVEAAEKMASTGTPQPRILEVLTTIGSDEQLRRVAGYDRSFWNPLAKVLKLEATVLDESVDITHAYEVTAQLNWELLEARRVGTIVPGRTALVIRPPGGERPFTFIRGERKLKFKVLRAKGSLRRLGNTLTMDDQRAGQLQRALLQVERIDTLSHLDPAQALAMADSLALPDNHPAVEAARHAADDPRHGRVLADLLVELLVGIDADIARSMARAEARANRL